jgi:hypothetical protein
MSPTRTLKFTGLLALISVGLVIGWGRVYRRPSIKSSELSSHAQEGLPTVTLCQVLAKPELYDRKVIRLRAIVAVHDSDRSLYDPSCITMEPMVGVTPEASLQYDPAKSISREFYDLVRPESGGTSGGAMMVMVGRFEGPNLTKDGRTSRFQHQFVLMSIEEAEPLSPDEHLESPSNAQETRAQVSREQALEVASLEARKTYDSLQDFNLVACETARMWLIIYDGGGPEYVVSKTSGTILSAKKLPRIIETEDHVVALISEQDAINIAKREAEPVLGDAIDRYAVYACPLAKRWVVSFEYREVPGELLPNSRSPFYVIDRRGGKVIYKEG